MDRPLPIAQSVVCGLVAWVSPRGTVHNTVINFRVAKRLDLNFSHCSEMVSVRHDGDVS